MRIPIVFILDKDYALPTAATLSSLILSADQDTIYHVYLIAVGLTEEQERSFLAFQGAHCQVEILRESPEHVRQLYMGEHSSAVATPAALLKFFLPDLLPGEDRVLYLDGDLLIRSDLTPLFQTELGEYLLAAVMHLSTKYLPLHQDYEHYFNSGVMLMDVAGMRREGTSKVLYDTFCTVPSDLMDQNSFNYVFRDRVKLLPLRWNLVAPMLDEQRMCWDAHMVNQWYGTDYANRWQVEEDGAIIHYIGKYKPWKRHGAPYGEQWYHALAQIPGDFGQAALLEEWQQAGPIRERVHPRVSVVMPVYNVEQYLPQALDSLLLEQTMDRFELICVDDGSTDGSLQVLEDYAARDSRIRILRQANVGAGAARNLGFQWVCAPYCIFLDSDDLFRPDLLELTLATVEQERADIVGFQFSRFFEDGSEVACKGVHTEWLPEGQTVFSWQDCPDHIMSVVNPTPWNKLYRCAFLRAKNLRFEEISSTNDITFAAVSVANAERVAVLNQSLVRYRVGHSGTISSTKTGKLCNVSIAVSSAVEQIQKLWYHGKIRNAVRRFAAENLIFALRNYTRDLTTPGEKEYYAFAHRFFQDPLFAGWTRAHCENDVLYLYFSTVRDRSLEEYRTLAQPRITVSFTSYPARIGYVAQMLESVYAQTRPADEVILWLAEEQFPGGREDLPEELTALVDQGRLTLRWCDDLKPHKKYFYLMQEAREGVIITVDDDLIYPQDMIETLCTSYLFFPKAVSAMRTHLMTVEQDGTVLPYALWIKETDVDRYVPSHQLLATTGAGTLFPAGIFPPELFDRQAILENCLQADDLWMKIMELIASVPVVTATNSRNLKYVPGSQEEGLRYENLDKNANDIQFLRSAAWADEKYGPGFIRSRVTAPVEGVSLVGVSAVARHALSIRTRINDRLQKAYAEKSMINAKLQQAWDEKSEINAKLQQTYAEKSEINAKLQRTYEEKSQRGAEIQKLKQQLRQMKQEQKALKKTCKSQQIALKQTKAKLKQVKQSLPYRLGRFLTWPVRKLKKLLGGK